MKLGPVKRGSFSFVSLHRAQSVCGNRCFSTTTSKEHEKRIRCARWKRFVDHAGASLVTRLFTLAVSVPRSFPAFSESLAPVNVFPEKGRNMLETQLPTCKSDFPRMLLIGTNGILLSEIEGFGDFGRLAPCNSSKVS